jgi:hypothetical protein
LKTGFLVGLAVVCASGVANAGEGSTNDRFAAPNGQLGAGLSASPDQHARVYAELGYWHTEPATVHLNSFGLILGAGVKVAHHLELEAMLPLSFAEAGNSSSGDTAFATGNLHVGGSYVQARGPLRLKLGAGVEFGPWTSDYDEGSSAALLAAYALNGGQDLGLWAPEALSFVTPMRVEYDVGAVLSADFAAGVHVPTNGGDVVVTVQVAPGIGYYVSNSALIGLRAPLTIVATSLDEDDFTLFAVEPYARFDLGGGGFLNARFTLNIDEPFGFSFDEGQAWGLHAGGGGTF